MSESRSRLFINEVKIKNYRTYFGDHKIKLSNDLKKSVTIIHGKNGRGKTTFLNCILWALYGKERPHSDNREIAEGIMNKQLLDNLEIGNSAETFVSLWIYDDDGPLYHIKRHLTAKKEKNSSKLTHMNLNNSTISDGIEFETSLLFQFRNRSGDLETLDHIDTITNRIQNVFPEALSSYVFFDAELLSQFVDHNEEKPVKDGIEKISDLPIMDNAVKNLKKSESGFESILGKTNIQYKLLYDTKHDYESQYERKKSELDDINDKFSKLKEQEDQITNYLSNHSESIIVEKQKLLDECETREKYFDDEYEKNENDIKNLLFESTHKLYLKNSMMSAESKFQKYQDDGIIPPVISKIALDDLLDSVPSKCICGRSLETGSDERKTIEDMRVKIIDSVLIQDISRGRDKIRGMLEYIEKDTLDKNMKDLMVQKQKLTNELNKIKNTKKQINNFLLQYPLEEIKEKSGERKNIMDELLEISGNRTELENQIKFIKNKLEKLETELKIEKAKIQTNESAKFRSELCRIASKILQNKRNSLLDEFKEKVSDVSSKVFLEIAPRKSDFKCVQIRPDFQIQALDNSGDVKELAAGQRHCLGLSYIAAMRQITRQNYFLMIDSPLHNIDQETKTHIAKILPKYLEGTQLTLLVTDQEYTGEASENIVGEKFSSVRKILKQNDNVWKEYILEIDEHDTWSRSKIREVD